VAQPLAPPRPNRAKSRGLARPRLGTIDALVPGQETSTMSKLLRGAAAGFGAWKLGGGLIGTILIFVVLWIVLGHFDIFK
jgi:hypothetical protein